MKTFIFSFALLACLESFGADTFFLSQFVGNHKVVKNICKTDDLICKETTDVELIQVGDSFILNEYNAKNVKVSTKELKQEFLGLITTTIGGFDSHNNGGFIGLWNLLEKDANGQQVRTESVYFYSNSLFSDETIKISIQSWRKPLNEGEIVSKARRDYILSR